MSQKNIEPNPSEVEKERDGESRINGARIFFKLAPQTIYSQPTGTLSAITHESYYGIGRTGGGGEK